MPASREIIISERAAERIAAARAWLESQPSASEVLVIASVKEAGDDLVRAFAMSRGAMLGVHRMTLNRLVGLLAAEELADAGVAPADGLAAEAVAARAVFRLAPSGALAHFDPVLNLPGFSRALARTLLELRWNNIGVDELRAIGGAGEAIAATLAQFDAELADAKLIDRAGMLKVATRAVLAQGAAALRRPADTAARCVRGQRARPRFYRRARRAIAVDSRDDSRRRLARPNDPRRCARRARNSQRADR